MVVQPTHRDLMFTPDSQSMGPSLFDDGRRGPRAPQRTIQRQEGLAMNDGLDVGQLYRQHAPALHRRIRRFYEGQEAEEVLHEVFLVVLERVDQFRGEASPSTWLYRVATNHCLNRLRNHRRRQELWLESKQDLWYASRSGAHQESSMQLAQLWRDLPQELVAIGVYHYVDGMTHGEIARMLGVSRRTIGNRLEELAEAARAASGI